MPFDRPRPPTMNADAWRRHRLGNAVQSVALLGAMAALLAGLGWIVAGGAGAWWALAGGALLVALNPGLSPRLILRLYGARPLAPEHAPELYRLLAELSRRADLPAVPVLHHVPSRMLNAFAVGTRSAAAIAVTDGLLRQLTPRELAGVLAHEVSHVRHNDMWVMGLADLFSRLTQLLSTLGQLLVLAYLPLAAFAGVAVSWVAIAALVLAPTASALLQLALSRTREYDADLGAAALTGDPRGLASALEKLERTQRGVFERVFLPGRRVPDPSLLRTHPPTAERIRRLLELESKPARIDHPRVFAPLPAARYPRVDRRPRWHVGGSWY